MTAGAHPSSYWGLVWVRMTDFRHPKDRDDHPSDSFTSLPLDPQGSPSDRFWVGVGWLSDGFSMDIGRFWEPFRCHWTLIRPPRDPFTSLSGRRRVDIGRLFGGSG